MSDVERSQRRTYRTLTVLLLLALFCGFMAGFCVRDAALLGSVREEGKP